MYNYVYKIMCINILKNIKAVAPKLQEGIAGQTMYLYPDGWTNGRKDGRTDRVKLIPPPPTLRRGGIKIHKWKIQRFNITYNQKRKCEQVFTDILFMNNCNDYICIILPLWNTHIARFKCDAANMTTIYFTVHCLIELLNINTMQLRH